MRVPYFAELSLPRCMREKKFHAQIVNKIPFDMVDAWKERVAQLSASRTKFIPMEFTEIIDRTSTDEKDACLSSLLQYSIQNKINTSTNDARKLSDFVEIANELMPKWTAAEAGMILRCLIKLRYMDATIYNNLLQRIACKRQQFSVHASIVALDVISTETRFESFMLPVIEKIRANVSATRDTIEIAKLALGLSNFLNISKNGVIIEIIKGLLAKATNDKQLVDLDIRTLSVFATVMSRTLLLSTKLMQIIYMKIDNDCDNLTLDNCAVFANCISQLGHARAAGTISYFELLGDAAAKLESQMNGRLAAVLINAFAKAHVLHQDLFTIISKKLFEICPQFDTRQTAMIAHAFAKLGHLHNIHVIWDLIGDMSGYNWQELAMILYAYTKSGGINVNFINNICKAMCKQFYNTVHSPTGLVSTSYSLYKSRSVGIAAECDKLFVMISQKAVTMLNRFKSTELANLCLSLTASNPSTSILMPKLKTLVLNDVDGDSVNSVIHIDFQDCKILL